MKYNPFKPNTMVHPNMFAGRGAELFALERMLIQTKLGNAQHFLISGERGIGKSSLLLVIRMMACGKLSCSDQTLQFASVNVELEPANSYPDIIKVLGNELHKEMATHFVGKEAAKKTWEFLTRWQAAGVKYTATETRSLEPHELLGDLTESIAKSLEQGLASSAFEAILITIDEADKPGAKGELGQICKLLTERLTKIGCDKVLIGLAGLPKLNGQLRASHESSPRIFQHLSLKPLEISERRDVISRGIETGNSQNEVSTSITTEAADIISTLSEGYPHFIQQFAYCAFEADTDNQIDASDVYRGAQQENGAFHQLGEKYFHELYWEQVGSDEYRTVLNAMADGPGEYMSKQQIRTATQLRESTIKNALSALRKRNIIVDRPGLKGYYRLPTRSFAVWIKAVQSARNARP